jgi:hypothetical protein
MFANRRNLLHLSATLTALLLCAGCGSRGPYSYVPVHGVVQYEDGSKIPIGGMRLTFFPQDAPEVAGAHPRQAIAIVDEHGEFACATTYKYGDGLIPGKHKVVIQAEAEKDGQKILPKSCLGPASTTIIVDTANLPLEVKVPKPQ